MNISNRSPREKKKVLNSRNSNIKRLAKISFLCLAYVFLNYAHAGQRDSGCIANLQELIDSSKDNAIIILHPGVYCGPVTVAKPVTIDGNAGAIVDGQNKGTVVSIKSNGVKIRNLKIINSGDRYDLLDSAISMSNSSNVEIVNNRIENCLFGISLKNSHDNLIKGNKISSKPFELGLRGDGLYLWWSDDNHIANNEIFNSRDCVIWYSMGNIIENNIERASRYSIHFMFSDINYVRNNYFENNSVGVYNMYSSGIMIENNTIVRSLGATGMGIGLKEASDMVVKNNKILYCSRGIAVDESPFEPDAMNYFINNEIVFNNEAVTFVTDSTRVNNVFEGNIFRWNIQDVTVSGTRGVAKGFWERNYWDKYEGFTSKEKGVGDRPYKYYIYAEQLWLNNPALQFFRGSVLMTFLDFLERLAPFSQPEVALVDSEPLLKPIKPVWMEEQEVKKRLMDRIAGSKLLEERRGRKGAVPLPSFQEKHDM